MTEDVIARAFEPFFTTKEVGRGSGLGLSQVYGFAQQSGGAAAISSQQGEGTRVTMWLPRAPVGDRIEHFPSRSPAGWVA
jgi:signal transduction histidine kinase